MLKKFLPPRRRSDAEFRRDSPRFSALHRRASAVKAKGLDEESLFKPGRHTFRRRDPNKIVKRDNKTVVLHLDEETYAYYQRRAVEKQADSVEEQIKLELRGIVEKEAA